MKIIVELKGDQHPPLLALYIHNAPHRRMNRAIIFDFRKRLVAVFKEAGIALPIDYPIDLSVLFTDPSSPDLGNLFLALEMALDGKNAPDEMKILADDDLIQAVYMTKFFPHARRGWMSSVVS